jgi:hypothetical protein
MNNNKGVYNEPILFASVWLGLCLEFKLRVKRMKCLKVLVVLFNTVA